MTPEVMLPELGHFALIISLAFAICLSIIPLVGLASNQQRHLAPVEYLYS